MRHAKEFLNSRRSAPPELQTYSNLPYGRFVFLGGRKKQSSLGNNCHNMLPSVWERQCRPAETVERGRTIPPHIPTYFLRRRAAAQNANAPIRAATAAGSGTIERFAVIVEMPSSSDMLILPAIPSWSFRVKSSAETLLPSVANDIKSALHPSLSEASIHACKS